MFHKNNKNPWKHWGKIRSTIWLTTGNKWAITWRMMKTKSQKERKTVTVPVRMTEAQAAMLIGMAKVKNTTASDLVRKAIEQTDLSALTESDAK